METAVHILVQCTFLLIMIAKGRNMHFINSKRVCKLRMHVLAGLTIYRQDPETLLLSQHFDCW